MQDERVKQKDEIMITLDEWIDKKAVERTELKEIIARITEELSLSLEEKEELRGRLSSLNQEQELLKSQLQELGGENQALVGQLSDSQGRIQSLLESLSSSKGENEILETQISSVESQNQSLRDQISSLEQDSEIQTTSLNDALSQISRLSEDIKIMSNEIQLLTNLLT